MGDPGTDGALLLVSRSMPPDVGGYQRQFLRLAPHLAKHFESVTWIGAVKDRTDRSREHNLPSATTIALPASWVPRRIRGASDLAVVAAACVWLLLSRIRGRTGVILLLSPTMIGGAAVLRCGSMLRWRTAARFPSGGDQVDPRGRRVGSLTTGPNLVPSPGQLAEQTNFPVVDVLNAVEDADLIRAQPDAASGTFLFVGRLVLGKRPDLLLTAWSQICDQLPGWSVTFVGDGGSQRNSVEEQLHREVQSGRVPRCTFVGSVPDPMSEMARADVFVFPSVAEGLPNSMLEAFACGLPVIADPALARQWFGRPVPLLAWDGAAESLGAAMLRAALDVSARTAMGAAGPAYVRAHHAPAAVAERMSCLLLGGEADAGCSWAQSA